MIGQNEGGEAPPLPSAAGVQFPPPMTEDESAALVDSLASNTDNSELWERLDELERMAKSFGTQRQMLTMAPGVGVYFDLYSPPDASLALAERDADAREAMRLGFMDGVMFPQERYKLSVTESDLASNDALSISVLPLQSHSELDEDETEDLDLDASNPVLEACGKEVVVQLIKGQYRLREEIPKDAEKWVWDETNVGLGKDGEKTILIDFGKIHFQPGDYTVLIGYQGPVGNSASLRATYSFVKKIDAPMLVEGTPLQAEVPAGVFGHFRFVHPDPSKLLTITAKPVMDNEGNPIGDPDLYVSNMLCGMSGADRESYTWKSTNVGADRVDIHPDDPLTQLGNTYLVGILGYKDRNRFEVEAKVVDPQPIHEIRVGSCLDHSLEEGSFRYYRLNINSKKRGKIFVKVNLIDKDGNHIEDTTIEHEEQRKGKHYSRGVYTNDDLGQTAAKAFIDERAASHVRPVFYISNNAIYPSAVEFSWRASSKYGPIQAVMECDEWKYTNCKCHIAICAENFWKLAKRRQSGDPKNNGVSNTPIPDCIHRVQNTIDSRVQPITYRLVVTEVLEQELLAPDLQEAYEFFKILYSSADAGSVSHADRAEWYEGDSSSLTYGEVEFVSFNQLLSQAQPQPGEVFYDLGSGSGKPVFIAALTSNFSKCIGIELLPGLHSLSLKKLEVLQQSETWGSKASIVEMRQGDMLELDWSDADVVYTSSICFVDELMEGLAEKAKSMKPGSRFFTLKLMPNISEHFDVISQDLYKMTWGRINVYILKRNDFDFPYTPKA